MSRMRALLVEDDEPKQRAIVQFFNEEFPSLDVVVARSLTSAIDALVTQRFALAVVDMSLPTYDLAHNSSGGGTPQGFGGEDVLRFISSEADEVFTVVVTQYEEFPSGAESTRSLDELRSSFKTSLGDRFRGIVYYSGQHGQWRGELRATIKKIGEEEGWR